MTEKKHRIEDALEAVKSAQEEGVVPGGGTLFLNAANNVEIEAPNQDQLIGCAGSLLESCFAPMKQILKNADVSSDHCYKFSAFDDHDFAIWVQCSGRKV